MKLDFASLDLSFILIILTIIGAGVLIRQSLLNKINEGFKNESFEKQRRWDLKQKIYFDLLNALHDMSETFSTLNKLHESGDPDNEYTNCIAVFLSQNKKLMKIMATARIVVNKDIEKHIKGLSNLFRYVAEDCEGEDKHSEARKVIVFTYFEVLEAAKQDLKIESPI